MVLEDGLLIACKENAVELTAHVTHPREIETEEFRDALVQRVEDHRYTGMTDPRLLDSEDLGLASVLVSREPMPEELKEVLASLGFAPETTEVGGRSSNGLFSRFSQARRSQLDRWRLDYGRARDVNFALHTFESYCVANMPEEPLNNLKEAAKTAIAAADQAYRLQLRPGATALTQLEGALNIHARHRLVLHPAAIGGLTAFVIMSLHQELDNLTYEFEGNPPVIFPTHSGPTGTYPERRVISYVTRGQRASLVEYLQDLKAEQQGLTA